MRGDKLILKEVYPEEYYLAEASLPYVNYGDSISLLLPPESVRYIKLEPYAKPQCPQLFGAPGRVEKTAEGYSVFLEGRQGEVKNIALMLPEGEGIKSVSAQQVPTVRLYTFGAGARLTAQSTNISRLEVRFPLDPALETVSSWLRETDGENAQIELPVEGFGFMGCHVSGSYSEDFNIRLDITTEPNGEESASVGPLNKARSTYAIKRKKTELLSCEVKVPFIEPMGFGTKPGYEDDCVMHLVFEDPSAVEQLKVWLKGTQAEVKSYRNPMRRDWFTYYIELTDNIDPGNLKIKLQINWKD